MKELIVSVTLVSLITSLSLMIMPGGSLKRYVKLASSLAFCAFVISSVSGGSIGEISLPKIEIEDRSEEFYEAVVKKTKENTEKNVKAAICKKFSVSENDAEVRVELSKGENGLEISDVYIKLYGIKNTVKVSSVKKYAEELLDTEVIVKSAE